MLALASAGAGTAAPTILDFEDFAAGTPITTQYGRRGVAFSLGYVDTDPAAPSGTQVLRNASLGEEIFEPRPIFMAFPIRAQSRVKLLAMATGIAQEGTLIALDAAGNVVAQDGPKPVPANVFTTVFEVTDPDSTPSITRAELHLGIRFAIDDLEFEAPVLEFQVKAFAGTIALNGGKCLDYQPEITGSTVVLGDCASAHAITVEEIPGQQHQVHLRAGTKVIGVRRNPTILWATEDSPDGLPLELQDPGVTPEELRDQTFALDGDSIIYAADRAFVARVDNARGRNGTAIVMGRRALSVEEFWDFRATDGSGAFPTSGFRRVSTRFDLFSTFDTYQCYLRNDCAFDVPGPGGVVVIDGEIELPRGLPSLVIPPGVTLRADRRTVMNSGIIRTRDPVAQMFDIGGNDVRITGLRIKGPSRSSAGEQEQSIGITVRENLFQGTIVDHNDISDWAWRGVYVHGGETTDACTDGSDPLGRPTATWVARNFIHHNRAYEKGYGVNAYSGGFPLIEGNVFYENRHAIAGTKSTSHTGYRAWFNLVQSSVPLQERGWGLFNWRTHDFDMHGLEDGFFPWDDGRRGRAGGFMDLLGNTFLGEGRHNFEIRGEPCHYVYVRRNISLQSEGDTINPGPALIITQSEPEQFDRPNPTTELGVGDFDGDGVDDLLLATGTTWYYSAQGVAEWRLINDNPDLVPTLRFGDFDGDGRTDVLGKNGRNLVASWGGVSEWETVNEIDAPLADLVVGQFDDDPIADIFYADGESWYISYDNGPFAFVNTSGFRVPSLRFGDFDGDGRTDVFGVGPREWRVSYAATTPWTPLRSRLTRSVDGLVVADFDGNGRADVALPFSSFVHIWGVSRDGLTDWRGLAQPTTYPLVAAGHVLAGDPRASLLLWGGNHFYRATFGESRVVRHSSQEMR